MNDDAKFKDQIYSNTSPTRIRMPQHEPNTSQNESNTNQHESDTSQQE